MTTAEWVAAAAVRLARHGVDAARLEAQVLAAQALGADRAAVLAHPDAAVPAAADGFLTRRLAGEPLAYILGYREFFGRVFQVNPSVLIPRQETETLVETALRVAGLQGRTLDVGTGSGCIAITLKLERPDLDVTAIDISREALATAIENAGRLGAQVAFIESDLFEAVHGPYDIIVSNPPYIAESAILPIEVREFEPPPALFAGLHGLDVYGRVAASARPALVAGGAVIVELGDDMADAVQAIFEASGWQVTEVIPDLGGVPRVMALRRRPSP